MAIVLTPLKHFEGGSHLTPDPVAGNRDLAVQLREIQTAINSEGIGVSVAVPQPLGVAAAGTATGNANEDHVHAHGNQLGGTLHADVVAGVSSGFMTAVQATNLAAIVDDHVNCVCAGINPKTDESEVSAALTGLVTKHFMPTHIAIEVTAAAAPLNGDATINIGTAADGAQIASALVCTGLTTLGAVRLIPLAAATQTILGNATLYANVESAEGGAGTATYKVTIIGRQF
jgi:hypothetical protein